MASTWSNIRRRAEAQRPEVSIRAKSGHERALVTVATMVGALVLARAVDDPRLSDALRKAALKHLALTQN